MYQRKGVYYIAYQEIPSGKRVRKAAGRDKKMAGRKEMDQQRNYEKFLEGTYNPMRKEADKPIEQHILMFQVAMEEGTFSKRGQGTPDKAYVKTSVNRIRLACEAMKVNRIKDLNAGDFVLFLQNLRLGKIKDGDGRWINGRPGPRGNREINVKGSVSVRTRDNYAAMLGTFSAWLMKSDLLQRDPFADNSGPTFVKGQDNIYDRMALTIEQIEAMAERFPLDAACLYLAATTGLRAKEMRHLEWSNVMIQGQKYPHIFLPAFRDGQRIVKNGKDAVLPLQNWVAETLLEHRKIMGGLGGRVFPNFPCPKTTVEWIQTRAGAVGIPFPDEQGRVLDFHAMRSSTATILFRLGCDLDKVQQVMRHAQIQTTIDHYRKFNPISDLAIGVKIPDPRRKHG